MKIMTLEEIKNQTLSTHMTRPNAVYKIVLKGDGVNFRDSFSYQFKIGDLVCVSGCGALDPSGQTAVFVGDKHCFVPNPCLEHYANPILQKVRL